ncbi:hypothetical protein BX666DRAFT_1057405 [Dichotomocladium elegans]|nr:hypothetical protein BX666DRAFT_1057405 [Dichotomocladium elegans]
MIESQGIRMDAPLYNNVPYDPLPVQQRRPMITTALPSPGIAHRSSTAQPYRAESKSPDTSKRLDDVMLQYQQQQQQQKMLQHQHQYSHQAPPMLPQSTPQDHAYLANHGYAGTSGGRMLVRDNQASGSSGNRILACLRSVRLRSATPASRRLSWIPRLPHTPTRAPTTCQSQVVSLRWTFDRLPLFPVTANLWQTRLPSRSIS